MENNEIIEQLRANVIQGRIYSDDEGFDEGFEGQPAVAELVEEALKQDVDIHKLILEGLSSGMEVVGKNYEEGKYLIPDMLAAAEAVGKAMDILAPHFEKAGVESKGTVIVTTVKGDLHDIGKNLVSTMLKGAGFNIIDLGVDVSSEDIVKAVDKHNPKFLGLSALLTTTMWEMQNVINKIKDKGLKDKVKVLVGGAPLSNDFAQKIGADKFCPDAFAAVDYTNAAK